MVVGCENVIPIEVGPVRFAVGPPNGLTSNAWRIWTTKSGDVYIACRDNFRETKVSLHGSGRWHMGFTSEAVAKNANLVACGQNRAWEVWNRPPESVPETVVAFRLVFLTSELAVRPEQRLHKSWSEVVFIEAGPPGKLTVLTLFITRGKVQLKPEFEPSFTLACLDLSGGFFAQVVAHVESEATWAVTIDRCAAVARQDMDTKGVEVPPDAYAYFFGQSIDGSRFIVGAFFRRKNGNLD